MTAAARFAFLAEHAPSLVRITALAELFCFDYPSTTLIECRQAGGGLARHVVARAGLSGSL